MINWQQLATPPEVMGNMIAEAIAWAQMDLAYDRISYSEFLFALDEIFECLEEW